MTPYDFPTSPTVGQVSNGYSWDGEKWKGGVPVIPDAPSDGGEYVRVNGVWRLVKQSYDLAAKATQDMLRPAWGPKLARVTAWAIFPSGVTRDMQLRLSADGTTFFTGSSDYGIAGYYHSSSIASPGMTTYPETPQGFLSLTFGTDDAIIGHKATVLVNLTRANTTNAFSAMINGTCYSAATGMFTHAVSGWVASATTASLTLGGLRWFAGGNTVSGNLDVEWLV
jgi:hypothetical protein